MPARHAESRESELDTAKPEERRRHRVPGSTYRVQLSEGMTFDDLLAQVDYLDRLGVTHVYLSPILQATAGSTHGYDVIDHDRIADGLGGEVALHRLAAALHERGLGAIADVVPNHMAVPVPEKGNRALWSVLREGPESPFAAWFDVDWSAQDGALLLPVLGRRIGECLRTGELHADRSDAAVAEFGGPVLRYFGHVFPLRPGTEELEPPELLRAQFYRPAYWRVAAEEPGYRRFFDISSLIAIRVEDPGVLHATHRLLLELVDDGTLDGLRIDHPDGLADPRGYLSFLHGATGGAWTVVEKILGADEQLPADWECAGTTGYDAQRAIAAVLTDPIGAERVVALYSGLTGSAQEFGPVARQARLGVLDTVLRAEVDRLVEVLVAICHTELELRDHTQAGLRETVSALIANLRVYRAYTVPGESAPAESVMRVEAAAKAAATTLPAERHETLNLVRDLALGRVGPRDEPRDEFQVRFQQTCAAVMAKGVEDTAFYRWTALPSASDVGGEPTEPAMSSARFHGFCALRQSEWPAAMTALSTHDSKRSEDVRARLALLTELPDEWAAALAGFQVAVRATTTPPDAPDPADEYLLWQTLFGAWPIDADRLLTYLRKALREAKGRTSWSAPNEAYEDRVLGFAEAALESPKVRAELGTFTDHLAPYVRSNILTQKLVQLTMAGIPDVYQGTESEFWALTDPDNRRPVDFPALRALLDEADAYSSPGYLPAPTAKILITSRALRLRRERPEWFAPEAPQTPLFPIGPAADHALAFLRGEHVAVIGTRLSVGLERAGGWRDTTLSLPPGHWRCRLSGREYHVDGQAGIGVPLGALTEELPVALLVREDAS
ncbi:malto-oligosyltrehalose synthase [Actinospica sp.]|uniref:malto-oligosyltrehalose synthase n=1 Tax=Actinospica sp. TaxID=1872142 RepID=UPI002C6A50E5|nr:malto-oligosyltrehalose synthase [Actinospica sp.]HWG25269.1 malto-oligosyltrehalose synthase [Actinospica sp.]